MSDEESYNEDGGEEEQEEYGRDYGGGYAEEGGEEYAEPEEEQEEEAPEEEYVEPEEEEATEPEEQPEPPQEEEQQEEPEAETGNDYDYSQDYSNGEFGEYEEHELPPEEQDLVFDAVARGNLQSIDENAAPMVMPTDPDGPRLSFGSMLKGSMDGFGGGGIGDIMGTIQNITGGDGGGGGMLTNLLAGGGVGALVEKGIASAAQHFLHVNPETGLLIGSIAGNLIFKTGGQNNSLGSIGKMILENIMNGKFRRDITPFVPPVPGTASFNLDFHKERERCLQERRLFEDPEFPACDRSLYFKEKPKANVEWKRPSELVSDPQLIVEGHSRFDVMQGALGDCWLLAAIANLTLRDELFYRVVPPDQSFTENYAGIFHFQFWRYGRWVDVVIDDKLPTVNGKLYYIHSREHNEFWSALLEKAYAKLYGSYENLDGGTTTEALEDFTGGLTESYNLHETDKATILAMLVRGFQMGSLFGCSISADPSVREAVQSNGLVRGHAYSITGLQTVTTYRGETVLLRIRNPWGNEDEWNGPWSDGHELWNEVPQDQQQSMRVKFRKDGEFWMCFDDFVREYEEMEVCNLSAEVMNEICEMTGVSEACDASARGVQWKELQEDGVWSDKDGSAGGCQNNAESFWRNPQYGSHFTVTNESVEHDGKCTAIVAVLQKYRRELRVEGKDSLPIGFSVYKAPQANEAMDMQFFRSNKPVARVPVFINLREVTVRFRVAPGSYVIVPCTFEPHSEAEFLMRVYANGEVQARRLAAYA